MVNSACTRKRPGNSVNANFLKRSFLPFLINLNYIISLYVMSEHGSLRFDRKTLNYIFSRKTRILFKFMCDW